MTREEGLAEIDNVNWVPDEWGCQNIYVHDEQGRKVHCWIRLRPEYCDRGHIELQVELDTIDSADRFPRYFFSTEEAKRHAVLFLKWRIWKHRTFRHEL